MAVTRQFPAGARGQGVALMRDHGCQPTSTAFLQACGTLGIQQAFTSDNNPKGQADTERVMRTRTEACLWRQEWTCPFALMTALASGIATSNAHYLHSALGYKPPRQCARTYYISHGTHFTAV
jgi:putative transposase